MSELRLDSTLQYLKGVGPRKAEVLSSVGMNCVRDLLDYFPRQYLDRTSVVPIGQLRLDQPATIIGEVVAHGMLYGRRKRYEMILQDETGNVMLLWFAGVKYFERLFKKGQKFAATGTPTYFQGMQMVHPDLERLEEDTDRMVHAGRIIPVYPQTSELSKVGLNSKSIRRLTTSIFSQLTEQIPDHLPEPEQKNNQLIGLHKAIEQIHYPDNREQVEVCRRRLAYDELLRFQYLVYVSRQRKVSTTRTNRYAPPAKTLKQFKKALPFELTSGQKKAVREIFKDLQSGHPMFRMLQGDVGCGKTVVAMASAVYAAENNLQTAFMAPTEILAEQHFRNWEEPLRELGFTSGLLTSSLRAPIKKKIAEQCAAGEIDVLFGTHALIYDYVSFPQLGLVIIDEQHRFGVQQRSRLHAKGNDPDLLVMTATPIPRTLALTLYGDLDISTIDSVPPGRLPVRTALRGDDVADKVYQFVIDEIGKGGQAYIIYPLIEKSDELDLESVEDGYADLSTGPWKNLRCGMIHGRVKPKERDELLLQFRNGELDVLFSTVVIEVGIDNPNATVMVIKHAERFGLAQLHQLRGRIGRGTKQSTLVAIAKTPLSEISRRRLEYFVSTTDGFKIAEADLELRGPGEIFGTRQSGLPQLRAANLTTDQDLIEAGRELLERLFNKSYNLPEPYTKLRAYLKNKTDAFQAEFGGG